MQSVAQSWLVYSMTHSAVLLGVLGFTGQVPTLLLGPLAGVVADRHHRWRIIVITQALSMACALALAALTLGGVVREWHIFALVLALGCINAFDVPARQAFLGEMVGREDLPNAIALNSSMFNGARMIGPAIAGIVVATVGEGWCFLINGVSYVAVIAGLLAMRLEPWTPPRGEQGVAEQLREGLRYVLRNEALWLPLGLLGLVSLTAIPYLVLMPIFADQVLHGGARGLGILMSGAGLGALGAALAMARRENLRGMGLTMGWAVVGMGISLLAFSLSKSLWLSAALLVPVGFSMMTQMAATNTFIQSMVPDFIRGRVMSFYLVMLLGMAPFGSMLMGGLAHAFGAPFAVRVAAVCAAAAGALFLSRVGRFRAAAQRMRAETAAAGRA